MADPQNGPAPPQADEGGRHSLSGYLYQLHGTLGLMAFAKGVVEAPDGLEAGLTLIRTGELKAETLGQDFELTGGLAGRFERIFGQFKYSGSVSKKLIPEGELLGIVAKFHSSDEAALDRGQPSSGYLLVTNRKVSDEGLEMIKAAKEDQPHAKLDRQKKFGTKYRLILGSMKIVQIRRDVWINALTAFASNLGALDREAVTGRRKLVGWLMEETRDSAGVPVTDGMLREAFTGHPDARPLTGPDIERVVQDDLERFRQTALADGQLIRRDVVQQITSFVDQRCLIVVAGEGGRGKSTAMYQALLDRARSGQRSLVAAYPVNEVPAGGLREIVAGWRNLPASVQIDASDEIALERIRNARPDARPLLIVGIDGLDEVEDPKRDHVRDLIRFFSRLDDPVRAKNYPNLSPYAALVVTCRDWNQFTKVWLRVGRKAEEVPVADFAPPELRRAAKAAVQEPDVRRRLLFALRDAEEPESVAGEAGGAEIPVEVLEALRHPVMWHSFARLTGAEQLRVVAGDSAGMDLLADTFIAWFCDKTSLRHTTVFSKPAHVRAMLDAIGVANSIVSPTTYEIGAWVGPAQGDAGFPAWVARSLYDDAVSSGLVSEEQIGRWVWRHDFVRARLAAAAVAKAGG